MRIEPFPIWRAFLIVLGVMPFLIGVVPAQGETPLNSKLALADRVYQKHCALCHGTDGQGYVADNATALANQDFLVSVSDQFLWRSIANGRPGTPMAPHAKRYGGPLEDSDIDLLVILIRSWQKETPANISSERRTGNAAAGQATFARHCAECHGDKGQGVTAVSLNNPEFLAI